MSQCSLELQRAALLFLDRTDQISLIKDTCNFYHAVQDKAFQFNIAVDPSYLIETNSPLGNMLLNKPTAAAKVFQEVIFLAVSSEMLLPRCEEVSQIVVTFNIQNLPAIKECQLESADYFLKCGQSRKLLQYEGIVCGMSTTHKYTKIARFTCMESTCAGFIGNRYIRLHVPGAREAQTIRSDFTCSLCGSPLQEDVASRVLADKLVLELIDEQFLGDSLSQPSQRHQSIATYIRDTRIAEIAIGQKLQIIGFPVLDFAQGLLTFEACSVKTAKTSIMDPVGPSVKHGCVLPDRIRGLLKDRTDSACSFTLSLAYAFAGHIVSAGTYLHLKLGILLSLVSTSAIESSGLDLLVIGNDTLLLERLLYYAAGFSERRVIHSAHNPLTASVSEDKHGCGACFIEGGSILLAGDGVCVLNDINNLKKQMKVSLIQVLENRNIVVNIPHKLASKQGASQQIFLTKRCRIWATLDSSFVGMSGKMKEFPEALANVFGQVYYVNTEEGSYAESLQTHQTLLQAMGFQTGNLFSETDFQQLISFARQQKVTFSEACQQLIRGYYVASRRVRASSVHMTTLPVTAVKTLTSLAEAHAKLSLKSEVGVNDALIAILLYEESISKRFDSSVFGVKPLIHVEDNNLQRYIGKERDEELMKFYHQLINFISLHGMDDSFTDEREP